MSLKLHQQSTMCKYSDTRMCSIRLSVWFLFPLVLKFVFPCLRLKGLRDAAACVPLQQHSGGHILKVQNHKTRVKRALTGVYVSADKGVELTLGINTYITLNAPQRLVNFRREPQENKMKNQHSLVLKHFRHWQFSYKQEWQRFTAAIQHVVATCNKATNSICKICGCRLPRMHPTRNKSTLSCTVARPWLIIHTGQ